MAMYQRISTLVYMSLVNVDLVTHLEKDKLLIYEQ